MDEKYRFDLSKIRNLALDFAVDATLKKPPQTPATKLDYEDKVKFFFETFDLFLQELVKQNETRGPGVEILFPIPE